VQRRKSNMPFSAWTLLFSCGRAALERRLGHVPRRECRVALILQLLAAKEGTMLYTILVILIILIILGFVFGRGRLF
jgi:hypothetical protein